MWCITAFFAVPTGLSHGAGATIASAIGGARRHLRGDGSRGCRDRVSARLEQRHVRRHVGSRGYRVRNSRGSKKYLPRRPSLPATASPPPPAAAAATPDPPPRPRRGRPPRTPLL